MGCEWDVPYGKLTVGPGFYDQFLVETNLKQPLSGRVYVNLLEGI